MLVTILTYLSIAVEVICSFLLIGVILLQKTKGQGMGMAFGAGMGESLFGSQVGNVLTKSTVVLGIIFLLNTVVLAKIGSLEISGSVTENIPAAPAQPAAPQQPGPLGAPVAPGPDAGAPIAGEPIGGLDPLVGGEIEPIVIGDEPAPAPVPETPAPVPETPAPVPETPAPVPETPAPAPDPDVAE